MDRKDKIINNKPAKGLGTDYIGHEERTKSPYSAMLIARKRLTEYVPPKETPAAVKPEAKTFADIQAETFNFTPNPTQTVAEAPAQAGPQEIRPSIVVPENPTVEDLSEIEAISGLVYAEEFEDDEDELYKTDSTDKALIKDKHRKFTEIADDINIALKTFGYDTKVGVDLLSAMQFSRLIYMKGAKKEVVGRLFEAISNGINILTIPEGRSIADNPAILKVFTEAKRKQDHPVFLYVEGLKSADLLSSLRGIYDYIDNPNGDSYIAISGNTYRIPNNVYILFNLLEDEELCHISRKLLRYVSILEFEATPNEEKGPRYPTAIYLSHLRTSMLDYESCQLREDSWKKIDQLAEAIGGCNGYILQNKIIGRIENAAEVLLASGFEEDDVLDMIVSRNVITEALITKDIKGMEGQNLPQVLDSYFGADKMLKTRDIIKNYLSPEPKPKKAEQPKIIIGEDLPYGSETVVMHETPFVAEVLNANGEPIKQEAPKAPEAPVMEQAPVIEEAPVVPEAEPEMAIAEEITEEPAAKAETPVLEESEAIPEEKPAVEEHAEPMEEAPALEETEVLADDQ